MKQLSILFLCCLLLTACSDDDKNEESILVTDIVVSDADKVFKPGETITITAQGFQEGDQFIVDMRWPLDDPSGPIKEGSGVSIAVIKKQTSESISFLVPGHCPAATLKLLLVRDDKQMALCKVSVADGQAPRELQLYGITNSRSMTDHPRGIQHIDLATGTPADVATLAPGEDFSLVVNAPGNYTLCGLLKQDGKTSTRTFDLSTRHWDSNTSYSPLTFCSRGPSIYAVQHLNEKNLTIYSVNTSPFTRATPAPANPTFPIPDGFKPESLSRYTGVSTASYMLFAADNGNGSFSPVIFDLRSAKYDIHVFDPIQADALIPFSIVIPKQAPNPENINTVAVGFALCNSKANKTELRLWNTTTNSLEEPLAIYPYGNKLVSIATRFTEDLKTQEIYMLIEGRESGGLIGIYNLQKKEWRNLPNSGFPYSEILFAR